MEQFMPPVMNTSSTLIRRNMAINQRRILINDEIDDNISAEVQYYLYSIMELDKESGTKEPIEILIDSIGGSIESGLSMVSLIESMKDNGYKIITINAGKAYSMGFVLSIIGNERKSYRYGSYMIHDASSGSIGKVVEMEEQLEETKRLRAIVDDLVYKYTDITPQMMEDWHKRKVDKYFSVEDAKSLNIVDKVV